MVFELKGMLGDMETLFQRAASRWQYLIKYHSENRLLYSMNLYYLFIDEVNIRLLNMLYLTKGVKE